MSTEASGVIYEAMAMWKLYSTGVPNPWTAIS